MWHWIPSLKMQSQIREKSRIECIDIRFFYIYVLKNEYVGYKQLQAK